MMILVIPPNGGPGTSPIMTRGEKAGLVLEGFLQLSVDGESFDLRQGDSFQFDSTLPHRFRNLQSRNGTCAVDHTQADDGFWALMECGGGPGFCPGPTKSLRRPI